MHEWIHSEILAILVALIIIVVVSLAFTHHLTSNFNQIFKKIQNLCINIGFQARTKEIYSDYKSMLVINTTCVICQNPSTRRCSRCKSSRYCSYECQVIHWKEGHKSECHAPKVIVSDHINNREIMCNGKHINLSKNDNSTIQLNPISLGVFKSDNKKNHYVEKKSLPNQATKDLCNSLSKCESLPKPKSILFSYNYFIKLFEWNGLGMPCGLINCGNSCFANVVLQCLTYTRPLTAYLLNGCHTKYCKQNDWCFMCELQSHVFKVRHNQIPFPPIQILSRIRNIGNHLGYGRQEDAHEFVRFAIDSMQSICLDEFGGEKMIDNATQETTFIHHIFGGHLQSQVKCMECEHESNRYESMMDLAVEIHGSVESLEDAISQFTTIEMLDGDNKYKCDRCNAYVKAQKQITIHEAPNILTIALKRFQTGKFGKLNKRVTFPKVLNISPYMSRKTKESLSYILYAVVVHVDMLNASFFGHYICYVKDSDGIWYKIDDNKVKEVELDKVLAQRAYMLFYSRSKVRATPSMEGKPLHLFATSLARPIINDSCEENIQSEKGSNVEETNNIEESPIKYGLSTIKNEVDDILLYTNTTVYNGRPANARMSSNSLNPPNDSINFDTSNEDFILKDLSCRLSSNNDIKEVELYSNVARDGFDIGRERAESSHEHHPLLSFIQCLNNDDDDNDLNESPLVDDNYISSHCNVQNKRIKSFSHRCVDGIDELHSPNLQSISKGHSTVCNFPCTSNETKQRNLNETCSWNAGEYETNKCQHSGDNSERLQSAGISLNEEFDNMDIDCESKSNIQDILGSQEIMNEPLDHRTSFPLDLSHGYKKDCDRVIPCSSNVLIEIESLHSKSDIDVESSYLDSPKIHEFQSIEKIKFLEDTPTIQKPCNQSHTMIAEIQNLPSNVEKEPPKEIRIESSIERHDVSYNSRHDFEDEMPYVLVEPRRVYQDMHFQENVAQNSIETFPIDLHDIIMEPAKDVTSTHDFANNNVGMNEQNKTDTSTMRTKFKKQVSKPLFFPGFLIKSPKCMTKKSSNIVGNNISKCEDNIQDQFNRDNEGCSYDQLPNISTLNGKNGEDNYFNINCNICNHISSNGNHGDGRNTLNCESKDLPRDFGRENCLSIFNG